MIASVRNTLKLLSSILCGGLILSGCTANLPSFSTYSIEQSKMALRQKVSDTADKTSALMAQIEFLQTANNPDAVISLETALQESDPILLSEFSSAIQALLSNRDIPENMRITLQEKFDNYSKRNAGGSERSSSGFLNNLFGGNNPELLDDQADGLKLEGIRESLESIRDVLKNIIDILKPVMDCLARAAEQNTSDRNECNRECRTVNSRRGVCFPGEPPSKPVDGCPLVRTHDYFCRWTSYPRGHFGRCPNKPQPNPNNPKENCKNWDDVSDCLQAALVCEAGKEPRKVFVEPPLYVRCEDAGLPSYRQVGTWMCVATGAPNPPIGFP